ncbi:hypothetical protein NGRA_2130 [Nosema granulosis]|uniref:Uncharacterized protein n=1 Tax=Nosema granulosis TaxID=83296 RepID=A0A9P6GZX9_9MICR|nr:hypothetical protein NGRA_2130 [Nosema granulosis]
MKQDCIKLKEHLKFYMLLELEKMRQKNVNFYPFPIKLLEFEVLMVWKTNHTTLVLRKDRIEDSWCLTSKMFKDEQYFDKEGVFYYKDREAYKILEKLSKIENTSEDKKCKDAKIEETLEMHKRIIHAMEEFNRIKENPQQNIDSQNDFESLFKFHKTKNHKLLERLCEK